MNAAQKLLLVKPTIFQTLFGTFVYLLKKNTVRPSIQTQIGPYTLISETQKSKFHKFSIGIYVKNDEKVFIKTWQGTTKDLSYYSLVNEFRVNALLNTKLEGLKLENMMHIPKVKDVITSKNMLSVVFEYIEGKHLNTFPTTYQIDVLDRVCRTMAVLSTTLTDQDLTHFIKRTVGFYVCSLPFLLVLSLVVRPSTFFSSWNRLIRSIHSINDLRHQKLSVAHRDIAPTNIIMQESHVYLVDCEYVALTVPFYDLNYVSVEADFAELSGDIGRRFTSTNNEFLRTYMMIQGMVNAKHTPSRQNHYVSLLKSNANKQQIRNFVSLVRETF